MFEFDYCKQFVEFWQPQQNPFAFEDYELILPRSEIPKWFNYQSVGNYISFWIGCYFPNIFCCVVFELNEQLWSPTVQVSLKLNGKKLTGLIIPSAITGMMCNHVWFFKGFAHPYPLKSNLFDQNRVEVKFHTNPFGGVFRILRCGIHAECICPLVQHLSTNTLPPTSIPAFPICSISNTITPSPHLLNSCLELSYSNSMETAYSDFDSPLEGSHDDGCDLSLSLCTSPMGRNYPPPQPQVIVPDDASYISLPSRVHLDRTYFIETKN